MNKLEIVRFVSSTETHRSDRWLLVILKDLNVRVDVILVVKINFCVICFGFFVLESAANMFFHENNMFVF